MKRVLVWVILFTLVLTATGCGAKKKAEEALAEKIFEKATDSKIDIKGDKITIKDEQGQEVTFGTTEWPKSDLGKSIPEFKTGTITSVMDSPDYILVALEKVTKNEMTTYMDTIKSDFKKDPFEMTSEGVVSYMASNDKGIAIQITYVEEDGVITINVSKIK